MVHVILALLASIILSVHANAQVGFSGERAAALVRTLAVDIGPRTMGSPAEQQALLLAVRKFREFGCDTAYIMPVTTAGGTNTSTGVAVGIKTGTSGRSIVLGGHIDSSSPEVPGANDDASGAACVMELARVFCLRENASTLIFCCWGGEERGLVGSKYFVENYRDIDSVALMLQVDMADGASYLIADPDGTHESAPAWLLASAFETFYDDLHYEDLIYQTSSATLNVAAGGLYGSDHNAFVDAGIPAIAFTSDVTHPIHTPQDAWGNFEPSGLKRTGDLMVKLVEKYDAGVPSRTTERYQVLQLGSKVFIIPYWMLWALIVLALTAALYALFVARKRYAKEQGAGVPSIRLLVLLLLFQIVAWGSESLVGAVIGYRFPWVNNTTMFFAIGVLSGLLAVAVATLLIPHLTRRGHWYVYGRTAILVAMVYTLLAMSRGPELAMYPATILLCIAASLIAQRNLVRILLVLLATVVMYELVFFEGVGLLQRSIALNTLSHAWQNMLLDGVFVVLFFLLSMPLVFALASACGSMEFPLFRTLRSAPAMLVLGSAIVGLSALASARDVYDRMWFNSARIEQEFTLGADSSTVTMKGSEKLDGLAGKIEGRDTVLSSSSNLLTFTSRDGTVHDWLHVRYENTARRLPDSLWKIGHMIVLDAAFRPMRIDAVFSSDAAFEVESPWAHGSAGPGLRESDRKRIFVWYSFPDSHLTIPVNFFLSDSQTVEQDVTVTFDSLAHPIQLRRTHTNVSYRTFVKASRSFTAPADTVSPTDAVQ